MLSSGGGAVKREPAARNTMRTEQKRILCRNKLEDTSFKSIINSIKTINFISVPAGTTLMTVIFLGRVTKPI